MCRVGYLLDTRDNTLKEAEQNKRNEAKQRINAVVMARPVLRSRHSNACCLPFSSIPRTAPAVFE